MTNQSHNSTLEKFTTRFCSDRLGSPMGKVDHKFVDGMLRGIHYARSVNLTEVAKQLRENITLHATHKRLSRNLDNPELAIDLGERLLKLGAAKVRSDTRLVVHVYDLNKKYARKIEYLSDPDASAHTGFKVCEVLANNSASEAYVPLLARVWSDKVPSYVSDTDEILKAVRQVFKATGNKGLLCIKDKCQLSDNSLRPLIQDPSFDFIAMTTVEPVPVIYRNEQHLLHELIEQVETRYGKTMFKLIPEGYLGKVRTDLDFFMHAGALSIKLPHCDRPLSLIALKSKTAYVGEFTTPMLTSHTNLRSRKSLMGLVESFLRSQDVVVAHKSLRDTFNPADFRVLTYTRLQLLLTLLQAVIHYEVDSLGKASIKEHTITVKPHDGELDRTYLLPGHHRLQEETVNGE